MTRTAIGRLGALGVIAACLMLSACSGASPAPSQGDPHQTPSEARFQACAAEGGELRRQGRVGAWACVTLYADGGKPCGDKSDCLGKCAAVRSDEGAEVATQPGEERGVCAADSSMFGCRAEIIHGRSTPWRCID